uniref:S1-like domain-containing protein n=1 Tax=viral metagenome TaxID=1070528 RepID=A0A6C0EMC1_9ZZZZ
MPKGKGTKPKKVTTEPRKLLEKDPDNEEYAIVTKKLGDGRYRLKLNMREGETIGRLCGKMRRGKNKRQNWVDVDSVVLVGLREFQKSIVDIVHVYDPKEVRQLRKSGAFVEEARCPEEDEDQHGSEDYMGFDFDEI